MTNTIHQSQPPASREQSNQGIEIEQMCRTVLTHLRHELRTPLNAIIGYSEMLLEDAEDLKQEGVIGGLRKIHAAGKELLALVNDILDQTNIETGQLEHDPEAFGTSVCLQLEPPLKTIIADTEKLMEDIQNTGQEGFLSDLRRILSAARNFLALINDIANLAKKEFNTIDTDLKTSETAAMVWDVMDSIRPGAEDHLTSGEAGHGFLLVVDDNETNRDLLSRHLERQGHIVEVAENGRQALEMINIHAFDLILLDIMMPEMNGYQVLEILKKHETLRDIPVIMISALDEIDSVVRCIEMGAEDYLPKPFNPVLLKARIGASLEKKRFHDKEQAYLKRLQSEQEKSERLLLNILPKTIVERLKQGDKAFAESYPEVTVLFADIVDFTAHSAQMSPAKLIILLNMIFSLFDWLAEKHGLEKIKTIGDAYMVVGGLPIPRPDHVEAVAEMALDMQKEIAQLNADTEQQFRIRIGIATGPVVAGVIGMKKFSYDLWGDTVNTASRMESHGVVGGIQVTETIYTRLKDNYLFEARGTVDVKGKGAMKTYLLTGRKPTQCC